MNDQDKFVCLVLCVCFLVISLWAIYLWNQGNTPVNLLFGTIHAWFK
jgi:hypothetical protein